MKTLQQMTDEQLVELYENGNNKAFEIILMRYKTKVYAYIYLIVHNKELAEDIFQETFCKAIVTIQQGRYTDNGKFLGWINRIAHNLIIDHFRRERNENTCSADSFEFDIIGNNSKLSEKSYEDIVSNEQVLQDVKRLVEFLPESQRSVVKMRFFEDLSFKEIAEKTDVSINTALGRMRYALMNMRKIAEENDVYLELK